MFDTVDFWLEHCHYSNVSDAVNALANIKHSVSDKGTHITGSLGNMKVSIKETGVFLTGSLAKFYFGENQSTLTRQTTKEAVTMLADVLSLPIEKANVSRLDVAANIVTKHEPKAYYPYLGKAAYYNRLEQNNGIYYSNKQRQLLFYGKLHEQQAISKVPALPIYQGKNLLRYEYRILSRAKQQLKQTELTAAMLSNECFYMKILDRWKQEYFAINRNKILQFKPEIMNSSKDFELQLMQLGLQTIGGQAGAMAMIEQAKNQNVFENKMQEKRLKDKVKMLANMPEMVDSDLIKELDKKITETVKYYR